MADDSKNELTREQMAARIAELEARMAKGGTLRFKVSEKGAISVYGLGRFPVTLYVEQWECGCPEFVDTRVRWILDHGFVNNLLRHARVRSAVPQYAQQRAGGPRASEALASARACWPGVRIHGETSSRGLNAAAGGCRTVRYIRTPRCGREFEYSTSSDGPVRL